MSKIDPIQQLYLYQSATAFLKSYYLMRKSADKRWSTQRWANKLGFSKAAVVRHLNGGLSINESAELRYCRYFKFEPEESRYFMLLVSKDKMNRLYPELSISIHAIESIRQKRFKLDPHRPGDSFAIEDKVFISRPDTWWCLSLFKGPGLVSEKVETYLRSCHTALRGIDFSTIYQRCLALKLLREEHGRIVFKDEFLYMDSMDIGLEASIDRYNIALDAIRAMILSDAQHDRLDRTQNRGLGLNIKKQDFHAICQEVDKFMMGLNEKFDCADGDVVLDIQAFLTQIFDFSDLDHTH